MPPASAVASGGVSTEKLLVTWQIGRLEDILPHQSPPSWSQHLSKHLIALSRVVRLEEARVLLSNEIKSRLEDPHRNRGPRREYLCDADVRRVLERKVGDPVPLAPAFPVMSVAKLEWDEQTEQPIPNTATSTRSSRRNRVLSESPDAADTPTGLLHPGSPDLSASVHNRYWESHTVSDLNTNGLDLLARTAAASSYPCRPTHGETPRSDRRPSTASETIIVRPDITFRASAVTPMGSRARASLSTSQQSQGIEDISSSKANSALRAGAAVNRHKRDRESMIGNLKEDIQGLRYQLDIKNAEIKLCQHQRAHAQQRAERVRARLDSLLDENGLGSKLEHYTGFLAGLEALDAKYPLVLGTQAEREIGDRGQDLHASTYRSSPSGTSLREASDDRNLSSKSNALFSSLRKAIQTSMAAAANGKTLLQETRTAAEDELKVAEAAVVEKSAALDSAKEAASELQEALDYLGKEKSQLEAMGV